jgi:hypothetical protein
MVVAIAGLEAFSPTHRRIFFAAGLALAGTAVLAALNFGAADMVLGAFGKDSTLTGRTYLWQQGIDAAANTPLLGVGYAAYWVQGFSEPSGCGTILHPRPHRLPLPQHLYRALVETGYVGAVMIVLPLLAILRLCIARLLSDGDWTEALLQTGLSRSWSFARSSRWISSSPTSSARSCSTTAGPAPRSRRRCDGPVRQRTGARRRLRCRRTASVQASRRNAACPHQPSVKSWSTSWNCRSFRELNQLISLEPTSCRHHFNRNARKRRTAHRTLFRRGHDAGDGNNDAPHQRHCFCPGAASVAVTSVASCRRPGTEQALQCNCRPTGSFGGRGRCVARPDLRSHRWIGQTVLSCRGVRGVERSAVDDGRLIGDTRLYSLPAPCRPTSPETAFSRNRNRPGRFVTWAAARNLRGQEFERKEMKHAHAIAILIASATLAVPAAAEDAAKPAAQLIGPRRPVPAQWPISQPSCRPSKPAGALQPRSRP